MGIALRGKRLDSKGGYGNRRYVPGVCGPISHSSYSERYFVPFKCPIRVLGDPTCPGTDLKDWVLGVKWAGCLARLGRPSQSQPGPGVGDSWRMPSCAEQVEEEPRVLWTHSPIIRLCSLAGYSQMSSDPAWGSLPWYPASQQLLAKSLQGDPAGGGETAGKCTLCLGTWESLRSGLWGSPQPCP